MILIQDILLQWHKDCRGGSGAVQRGQFPQAARLPAGFFDYIPFGRPVHRMLVEQKTDGFRVRIDRRAIEEFGGENSLRLSPMERISREEERCELRYRYDWHKGAKPGNYQYDKEGNRTALNEPAFELGLGDYGRAICNGRFTDWDTGSWWYELNITNVLISAEKNVPLDCFLTHAPTHYYRRIAQIW